MTPKEFTTRSAGAKSAYCDGECPTVALQNFPRRVRTAANISQDFLENEGEKWTPLLQEPWLTISYVTVMADWLHNFKSQHIAPETRKQHVIYMSVFFILNEWPDH